MYKYLIYLTYGWLLVTGTLHFVIDVVSQHVRGVRAPGPETSLYYGLNSAFALGQVVVGLLGVYLHWRGGAIASETPVLLMVLAAAIGWLAITFLFMDYWEPKLNVGVFCVLVIAALLAR